MSKELSGITANAYIEKMVEKFLQSPIPECKTPNPEDYASLGKAANDDERLAMESLPYLSLIGSLLSRK